MKTKLKVLLKVVLMRSARQRLKMKIFVTVLIFWFSEYYDITTFQNWMRRAQSTRLIFSLSRNTHGWRWRESRSYRGRRGGWGRRSRGSRAWPAGNSSWNPPSPGPDIWRGSGSNVKLWLADNWLTLDDENIPLSNCLGHTPAHLFIFREIGHVQHRGVGTGEGQVDHHSIFNTENIPGDRQLYFHIL